MSWVEFLEAISRIADKFSPPSYLLEHNSVPYSDR
jgi:hypothetical protein